MKTQHRTLYIRQVQPLVHPSAQMSTCLNVLQCSCERCNSRSLWRRQKNCLYFVNISHVVSNNLVNIWSRGPQGGGSGTQVVALFVFPCGRQTYRNKQTNMWRPHGHGTISDTTVCFVSNGHSVTAAATLTIHSCISAVVTASSSGTSASHL